MFSHNYGRITTATPTKIRDIGRNHNTHSSPMWRDTTVAKVVSVIVAAGFSVSAGYLLTMKPQTTILPVMIIVGMLFLIKFEWAVLAIPIAVSLPRGENLPLGLNPSQFLLLTATAGLALRHFAMPLRREKIDSLLVLLGVLVLWPALLYAVGHTHKNAWLVLQSLLPAPLAFILGRQAFQSKRMHSILPVTILLGGWMLAIGLGWFFYSDPQVAIIAQSERFVYLRGSSVTPYMGSGLWIGLFIPPLSVAAIWALAYKGLKRWIGIGMLVTVGILSTLVNVRAGWGVVAVALGLSLLIQHENRSWRSLLITGLIVIITIWFSQRFLSGALSNMKMRIEDLTSSGNYLNRTDVWKHVISVAMQQPLLGLGLGYYNSHGLFFDLAGGFGFPYALLWIIAIGTVLRRAWLAVHHIADPETRLIIASSTIALTVGALYSVFVTTFMTDPLFTIMYWLIAGATTTWVSSHLRSTVEVLYDR